MTALSSRVGTERTIRVGIVGTGYAAKLRVEAFQNDARSQVIAATGQNPERTAKFCLSCGIDAVPTWSELVQRDDIDVIVICTVNQLHGAIARSALTAEKHVVVEYPLALDVTEAEELLVLARDRQRLLHIEQIDILSGIHEAIAQHLSLIGTPFYVRYSSLNPQHPAPQKWTYQPSAFGHPLVGALSRIHRLTVLFGTVDSVVGQDRTLMVTSDRFTSCISTAQLRFRSGMVAEVIYGKGEAIWAAERQLVIQGQQGMIRFDGTQGILVTTNGDRPLDSGGRRGLFAKDTQAVLDYLTEGRSLYVQPESSVYALKVADAVRRSAEANQVVQLS
jgi:biliverdin reductase